MIASAHVAAGFVAGMAGAYSTENRVRRIATAFGLGLLSHVVLDAIPHSDYWTLSPSTVVWVVLFENVGVCAIAGMILRHRLTPRWPECLMAGLAGSVILDAKFAARVLLPTDVAMSVQHYGDYIHGFFHAGRLSHPLVGSTIEIVNTVILLAILTVFPRTKNGAKG